MKPFHLRIQRGYFGDPLPIWCCIHMYSSRFAWGRTPEDAYKALVRALRAMRKPSAIVEARAAYVMAQQQILASKQQSTKWIDFQGIEICKTNIAAQRNHVGASSREQ